MRHKEEAWCWDGRGGKERVNSAGKRLGAGMEGEGKERV